MQLLMSHSVLFLEHVTKFALKGKLYLTKIYLIFTVTKNIFKKLKMELFQSSLD